MATIELREYEEGDEAEILETFNRVFAGVDPNFEPRGIDHWRWQYLGNPSGSKVLVAWTPEGKVAGQLGNVWQRVWLQGRLVSFSQAVDSMSDPALRKGLKKESLQARLGNLYAETWAGEGEGKQALLWGAPVPAAWRVGKNFIRYEVIRTQLLLFAPPDAVIPGDPGGVEVEEAERFPLEVADLFERCRDEHGAIAVRDAPQLDWRFTDHPVHDYSVAFARRSGRIAGYAVYRVGDFDGRAGVGLLCDWLVPAEDHAARAALLAWLRNRGRADGVAELVAVLPDTSSEWDTFQNAGFRAAPTQYAIVGRECVPGLDMRFLRENWYYTLGDTDLV